MKKILFTTKLILLSMLFFVVLRILPLMSLLRASFRIPGLSLGHKMQILYEYIIDAFWDIVFTDQLLTVVLSLLTGLNILLFTRLVRRQKKILKGKTFIASVSGMVMGLFGVGCLSCGVLILAPVLSFFGLSSYASFFLAHGRAISLLGIVIIGLSSYVIHRHLKKPLIC